MADVVNSKNTLPSILLYIQRQKKRNSIETPWGVWKRYELFGGFHFAFNFLVAIVMKFQERDIEDISTEPSLISFIPQSRSSK